MEAEGLEQKVSWLDEQRRRDLSVLEGFQERLAELEADIKSQREQSKDIASDLSRLNTLAARIQEFDDTLHKHRQEVSRQLKAQTELRQDRDQNIEEIRKADQEVVATRLSELKERLEAISSLEESLATRKEEELRITKTVDTLEKQVDDLSARTEDQVRSIATIEDGQNTAGQRLAEAQTDLNVVRQQVEGLKGSNDLIEDRLRRIDTQLAEIEATESEQTKTMEAWRENQSRKLVDFERQWTEWEARFATFEKMAKDLDEKMIQYQETYRNIRQLQSELEKVVERLERRINEVTEMQRLAEDRQKQEWRSFVADDTKRWNTHKLTMEEQWREHNRRHSQIDELLEALSADGEATMRKLAGVQENTEQRLRGLLDIARKWVETEELAE